MAPSLEQNQNALLLVNASVVPYSAHQLSGLETWIKYVDFLKRSPNIILLSNVTKTEHLDLQGLIFKTSVYMTTSRITPMLLFVIPFFYFQIENRLFFFSNPASCLKQNHLQLIIWLIFFQGEFAYEGQI